MRVQAARGLGEIAPVLVSEGDLNTQTGEISPDRRFSSLDGDTALAGRGRTSAPSRVPDDCSPTGTFGGIVTHRDSGPGAGHALASGFRLGLVAAGWGIAVLVREKDNGPRNLRVVAWYSTRRAALSARHPRGNSGWYSPSGVRRRWLRCQWTAAVDSSASFLPERSAGPGASRRPERLAVWAKRRRSRRAGRGRPGSIRRA